MFILGDGSGCREKERERDQSFSDAQYETIRCTYLDMAVVSVHMFLRKGHGN